MTRPALVLLALLAPLAAAEGTSIEGDLRFPDGARVRGSLEVDAAKALLDLSPAAGADETLLAWTRASGRVVEKTWTHVPLLGGDVGVRPRDAREERLEAGPGSLARLACRPGCAVVLFTEGVAGATMGLEAEDADAALAWLRAPRTFLAGFPNQSESFTRVAAAGWSAFDADAPRLGPRVGLFLWNVTGELRTADGARPFEAGVSRRPVGAAAEEVTTRFLVLELEDPRLLAPTPGATLLAEAPEVRLAGALTAPRAEGTLRADGRPVDLAGRSLAAEGDLLLRPRGDPATLAPLAVQDPRSEAALTARLHGDAARLAVGGAEAAAPPPARQAGAGAAALLVLLAALWGLKHALLSPFYTRIDPGRVLENPTRARLHALVRASPGLTPADLVRLTGSARVVVDHHLRVLASHGHLVARRGRRRIAYFPTDEAPDEAVHARVETLTDPTRRRLARLVLEGACATQKELAERAGVRARLVSHHLGRLEEAGLVAVEPSMPRRYRPTERLREAMKEGVVRVPVLDKDAPAKAPARGVPAARD